MSYEQLTLEKRYRISALCKQGYKQYEIAREIGVHPSTISRELQRNSEGAERYVAEKAQVSCSVRHKKKAKRSVINLRIERYVRKKLKEDWSPEQIAGRMRLDIAAHITHETIYRYIYANKAHGGRLYRFLCHKNKKYHKRGSIYKESQRDDHRPCDD